MFIFEALGTIVSSILLSYLSFTNILALKIENSLLPPITTEKVEEHRLAEPSTELSLLSKMYAGIGGTAKILKSDISFQEAALEAKQNAAILGATETPLSSEEEIIHSLVNIFCHFSTDTYTKTTTGTGFFINKNGVILTNAHVAQFLLLQEIKDAIKETECVIRTGNPASPRYFAELLFISPSWITRNAHLITEEMPKGTGEYDYALLYVSKALQDESLPSSYPSIPIDTAFLSKNLTGTSVFTAGYPASALMQRGAKALLVPQIASTNITELYTFGSNYADIFTVSSSAVGEQGASGGPIVIPQKGAIGLIVTKGDERLDGARSLRALSLSYVNRSIQEETGFTLLENTHGDLMFRGAVFKKALAPFLAKLLEFELR